MQLMRPGKWSGQRQLRGTVTGARLCGRMERTLVYCQPWVETTARLLALTTLARLSGNPVFRARPSTTLSCGAAPVAFRIWELLAVIQAGPWPSMPQARWRDGLT